MGSRLRNCWLAVSALGARVNFDSASVRAREDSGLSADCGHFYVSFHQLWKGTATGKTEVHYVHVDQERD